MRKTKEEAAITRENLLKVGLRVFSAKGFHATTLEDIAKEAGVTRGAIYWHFGGKAELYNTLVQEYNARGGAVMQQVIAAGGSLVEIMRRVFVRQLVLVEENHEMRAMMELTMFKTELIPELDQGRQQCIEAGLMQVDSLAEVMRQAIIEGELRPDIDPLVAARTYLAFQNGLIHLWLLAPDAFSLKTSAQDFADLMLRGMQDR